MDTSAMKEMRFSDWLKRQRTTRRLTQRDLERAADLSLNYVSRIESGRIQLPDEDTRSKFHAALGTTEDDLVAVGILERIESPEPGGEPVYIAAESITPGERQAERAHRLFEGRTPADELTTDPRQQLMDLLAGASDADVRKVVQIVTIMLSGIAANRAAADDRLTGSS
jgi:transcriptional regulator with XRE-family HTH domain